MSQNIEIRYDNLFGEVSFRSKKRSRQTGGNKGATRRGSRGDGTRGNHVSSTQTTTYGNTDRYGGVVSCTTTKDVYSDDAGKTIESKTVCRYGKTA
jgi:membrane protein involved in colicin uptake